MRPGPSIRSSRQKVWKLTVACASRANFRRRRISTLRRWTTARGPTRMAVPSGTEAARAFIPAKDFDLSKAFYEALGFKKLLDGDVAIFGVGTSAFILQRYYNKEWAENCMMQMMVDNLDAWWDHIKALDLPKAFGVLPPKAPAM